MDRAEVVGDFTGPGDQWRDAIDKQTKVFKNWCESGDRIVKRYRDERPDSDESKKLNILWSNVQTLKPALYSALPKPRVSRRYKDRDRVGKSASMVLERALAFSVDAYDFDGVVDACVEDYLLPGRAVPRVRYKPTFGQPIGEGKDAVTPVEYEEAECEYQFWKDFLHGPGRNWDDVPWVAFRYFPDRKELVKQFGKKIGNKIKLDHSPKDGQEGEQFSKAVIWEIWSKTDKKVLYFAYADKEIVKETSPPLNLHGFFPCPKPLYSLVTNDSLVPVPDYKEYQDQADELDDLSARIGILVKALRVAGFYAAEDKESLANITINGNENELIPVDSWAAFAEKGGLRGMIDWLPVDQIITVVTGLYEARDRTKQELYEITGLSDIMRGASDPKETATAQRIKGQFGSLRIQDKQRRVAKFVRDLLRLKAVVICEQFSMKTLQAMTGLELDPELWQQVMALFRSDPVRNFRIDIETDSTLEADEQADKESRIEFTRAMTDFMATAEPLIERNPDSASLLVKMMLFAVRGFRAGRELEDAFEEAADQISPEEPTPEQQAKQEADEEKAEQERQEALQIAQRGQIAEIKDREASAQLKSADAALKQVEAQERQAKLQLVPLEGQKLQAEVIDIQASAQSKTQGDDPIDKELERAERLVKIKNEAKPEGGGQIAIRRGENGELMGEVVSADGSVKRVTLVRDEQGNMTGEVQ